MSEFDPRSLEGALTRFVNMDIKRVRRLEGDEAWAKYLGMKVGSLFQMLPEGFSDEIDRLRLSSMMLYAPHVAEAVRSSVTREVYKEAFEKYSGHARRIMRIGSGPFARNYAREMGWDDLAESME